MLPFYLLSKTGIYDVDTNGVSVKTRVADQAALVDTGIDELKTELLNMKPPVVGLDVKECKGKAQLFILQTGRRCLIIQLSYLYILDTVQSISGFLKDQSICFVGVSMGQKICSIQRINMLGFERTYFLNKILLEMGDLAARILKKPNLSKSSLQEIASEVGILDDVKPALQVASASASASSSASASTALSPDWSAKFFSPEEVKCAIQEANVTYKVARKLVSMI